MTSLEQMPTTYFFAEKIFDGTDTHLDSALKVTGDRVDGIVPGDQVDTNADREYLSQAMIMPGPITAHGHAFQHVLRGHMDDMPWQPAVRDVMYPVAERLTGEDIYIASKLAFLDALVSGVTCFVDFFYLNDRANENAMAVIAAAKEVGMRLVFGRSFFDEALTWYAPKRYQEDRQLAYDNFIELARAYEDDPLVTVQPAPHSLRAASPATLELALAAAEEVDEPCHVHLNNNSKERQKNASMYGDDPVRFLDEAGLLRERLILVHAKPLLAGNVELIARAGAPVIHCANPDLKAAGSLTPVRELHEAGVTVGLGADSGCVNNRQSMFEEMHSFCVTQRRIHGDETPFDAESAIAMSTVVNGEILRLPIGRLAAGYKADFVALDLTHPSLLPNGRIMKNIVYSMTAAAITRVVVGGRTVVKDGMPAFLEYREIAERVGAMHDRIYS